MSLIDDYTFLVLYPESILQGRNAATMSVLFAELTSNTNHNRFTKRNEWASNLTQVLSHIGWTSSAFNMETRQINHQTVLTKMIDDIVTQTSATHAAPVKEPMKMTTKQNYHVWEQSTGCYCHNCQERCYDGDDDCMLFFEAAAGLKLADN